MKKNAQTAWQRYSRGRNFYFVYPTSAPHTYKLLDTGHYGVVQLRCIDRTVRLAYMEGYRAGKRHADNGNGDAK